MIRAGCGHASPLERKWWTGALQPAWCAAMSYAGAWYMVYSATWCGELCRPEIWCTNAPVYCAVYYTAPPGVR